MRPRTLRLRFVPLSALILMLSLLPGCEEPRQAAGDKAPAPAKKAEDTFIVGKRTKEIAKFDAAAETKKGGVAATQRITAKDPITLSGNAYVTMIGKTSILKIEAAMKLYQGANDRFPKDYEEFKREIVDANNIALPALPSYQKYAYDENTHKLLVIEYPELKNQPTP